MRCRTWIVTIALLLSTAFVATAQTPSASTRLTASAVLNRSALPPGGDAAVAVVVEILPKYHAQSHKPLDENLIPFELSFAPAAGISAGEPIYPPGKIEKYPALGELSVYQGKTTFYIPLHVKPDASPGAITLKASMTYQICDDSACFAPETQEVSIQTKIAAPGEATQAANQDVFAAMTSPPTLPQAPPRAVKSEWSVPAAFGIAILAGLMFNIMPCVLPVLPLKAVGFYEVSQHRRGKSFALAVVFSLGIVSVFAVLSMFVLVFRLISWGELYSQAWFIWSVTALLTVLGFGLLGGWTLSLPLGVYTFEPRHDTFGGNFFWGILTAVLATPCTAPFLPALLLWAANRSALVGVPAMLLVGVGMALPYLILSAMPEVARKLPRTGPFSELFKQMMGFMLLVAAAYFGAGRAVQGLDFWWIVVAVVAVASIFLVARTVQLSRDARPVGIASALAVVMFGGTLWWTAQITGLLTRGTDASVAADGHGFEPFTDDKFKILRDDGKPVLVKFTANWCGICQVIEGNVYRDPKVWEMLKSKDIHTLKVDLSRADAPGKALLLSLNPSGGIPLTAIWPAGQSEPIQLASYYNSEDLIKIVSQFKAAPSPLPVSARR